MAKFKFKYGVMSAGKSQELLRTYYNYNVKDEPVLIIVPSYDGENGVGIVQSRAGGLLSAHSVLPGQLKNWIETHFKCEEECEDAFAESDKVNYACVLIDETQFFTREDIFALKEEIVIKRNIRVIAYGLKTDFQNNLFRGSEAAFIVAEEVSEVETVCAFCNNKAIMNMRFNEGKPVRKGEQILIGQDEYKPVCNTHFLDDEITITTK